MIRKLLSSYPPLERRLRQVYQRIKFPSAREPGFSYWIEPTTNLRTPWEWANVDPESGDLFFGYYDKSPWSANDENLVMHFRPRATGNQIEIRLFRRANQSCQIVGRSRAWNFQQGAMAQWLSQSKHNRLVFNDVRDNLLVARIVTTEGKEESVVPAPVQAVHPDGRTALTVNYKRLWKLRPDYGYSVAAKNFSADLSLDRDGIWQTDFTSGQSRLVITLADLTQIAPRSGMKTRRCKVNHIIFSPEGTHCVFMHRWFSGNAKFSRLFVMDSRNFDVKLILDSELISHYHWLDGARLLVYGKTPDERICYFEMNVLTGVYKPLGESVLDRYGDGHPSVSPDKSWILTDTYPDRHFQQRLLLYHLGRGQLVETGRFLHPPRYYGVRRCDLHPRWNRGGQNVSFDSVWNGTRTSYLLDVSRIVQANETIG